MFIKTIKILFISLLLFCNYDAEKQAFAASAKPTEKVLIAGISADYPPFEFLKNGQIVGFDIDLANMIASKLGYKLQLQDMNFASIISSIQTDRIDFGISSITITPERSKNVAFSIKYYVPKLAIVYRKEKPILSVEGLNNKIIAVQAGTIMETFLQDQLKANKQFKLISLNKTPVMIEELKMGRADGVLIEESQAKVFVANNPKAINYAVFEAANYGYAIVFKKDSHLKASFDKAIESLKKSGELSKLKQKWLIG